MARILVIDDDSLSRYTLARILESEGHEVMEAENGSAGMVAARDEAVDLVISDIIMPQMEGIETIAALRKLDPDLPIIAISGGGSLAEKVPLQHARVLGATHALPKPFGPKQILVLVRDSLNSTG